ncbi:putative Type-F conjugative transfer system pilin assembly thiol-disulfide isomerase TrbB [Gammaproteobacteria bacterium]
MGKLKIVFLFFLSTLLVSYNSFASILNMEQSNHKVINSMFNSYNYPGSQFTRDYEFVFFYSLGCTYCRNFTPVLKRYSDNTGINVRGFILGGSSSNPDNYFPNSTVIKQEVSEHFFGRENNITIPSLFILNKKNLRAYPVSRGALTYSELVQRMDELIPKILNNEKMENHV